MITIIMIGIFAICGFVMGYSVGYYRCIDNHYSAKGLDWEDIE